MGSQHCIGGRGGVCRDFFKVPIIFCHGLFEIRKRKKKRGGTMHAVYITHIWLIEQGYVTLHSVIKIIVENGAKMTENDIILKENYNHIDR